ncbi:MAG: hypothetical protein LBS33_03060 [Streptococcaceae bacterium]|jgi:hypothetical protein|nr:hypothetical protein [Streptococcaceae bacterium]
MMAFNDIKKENISNVFKEYSNKKTAPKNDTIKELKKVYSFTLTPSLKARLDETASSQDMTSSKMLDNILRDHFQS